MAIESNIILTVRLNNLNIRINFETLQGLPAQLSFEFKTICIY